MHVIAFKYTEVNVYNLLNRCVSELESCKSM